MTARASTVSRQLGAAGFVCHMNRARPGVRVTQGRSDVRVSMDIDASGTREAELAAQAAEVLAGLGYQVDHTPGTNHLYVTREDTG